MPTKLRKSTKTKAKATLLRFILKRHNNVLFLVFIAAALVVASKLLLLFRSDTPTWMISSTKIPNHPPRRYAPKCNAKNKKNITTSHHHHTKKRQTGSFADIVDEDDGCGSYGSCLIHTCVCIDGYTGHNCEIQQEQQQQNIVVPSTHNVPFRGISYADTTRSNGYFRVSSQRQHDEASKCEAKYWSSLSSLAAGMGQSSSSKPKQNHDQVLAFDSFQSLLHASSNNNNNLGHVLEIGAGPYTKSRLLLETRPELQVKSITLVDPLLDMYLRQENNITTSYFRVKTNTKREFSNNDQEARLIVSKTPNNNHSSTMTKQRQWMYPVRLYSQTAEDPLPQPPDETINNRNNNEPLQANNVGDDFRYYDVIILVNTLEHCQNAVKVLHQVYHALDPRHGILILGEGVATERDLQMRRQQQEQTNHPKNKDPCHPLQLTRRFWNIFFQAFAGETASPLPSHRYLLPVRSGASVPGVQHAKNSIFTILQRQDKEMVQVSS